MIKPCENIKRLVFSTYAIVNSRNEMRMQINLYGVNEVFFLLNNPEINDMEQRKQKENMKFYKILFIKKSTRFVFNFN